jgi:carotenoid cleavage dioxygenase
MSDALLCGGFEPVREEFDLEDLVVEGALPEGLEGTYYRLGPNPQFPPRGRYNPLLGDGMVHAFTIRGGGVGYRNRWVRTAQWRIERAAGRALFATSGDPSESDPSVRGMRTDGVANTNLVRHGGRLFALEEGHGPIEIDGSTLGTLGGWDFAGALPRNMTAHPKIDPASGEMWFFANLPESRLSGEIAWFVADPSGAIVRSGLVQGPFPALVHDFAITERFVLFPVCPITVSRERARAGGPAIAWDPARGTHIGVFPKAGGEALWFEGPSAMAWHVVNAVDVSGRIALDVCSQSEAAFPRADGGAPDGAATTQRLTRWTLDVGGARRFEAQTLCAERCEYPRIDERRTGRRYRYAYVACLGGPGSGDPFHRGLGRFDLASRRMSIWAAAADQAVGEAAFAPRAGGVEGEGWLLSGVYDGATGASHLAILDASAVEAGPLARACLPHRMPMGFHGCWIAA